MSDEIYKDVTLNLGSKTYSQMNMTKDEWGMLRNTNQVYVDVNNINMSDLLQFPYDPNKKHFRIGKVKSQLDSSSDLETAKEEIIYVPVVTKSSEQETNEGVQNIVEGDGILINASNSASPIISVNTSLIATRQFVLDAVQQIGGSGGGNITINGITSIMPGTGIIINNENSSNPIVSVNPALFATKDYVNEVVQSGGTSGGGTVTNLSNPDYSALLEFLKVMQVQYEDDPVSLTYLSNDTSGQVRVTTGFRFQCAISETQYSTNCIRWKNFNTGGNRYNGEVYLKVIEYEPITGQEESLGYAALDEKILSVSSNSINQMERNEQNEWYEWYFPKQINFKSNYVYVIIPHHDKSYEKVTESNAKVTIFTTNDTNTSTKVVNGLWTSKRQSSANVTDITPIIQFCQKNPTTILMKQ